MDAVVGSAPDTCDPSPRVFNRIPAQVMGARMPAYRIDDCAASEGDASDTPSTVGTT